MKITCGTDIIEINRIKNSIERLDKKFLETIFTTNEIEYCESKRNMKFQHYAARFAAKEAVYKALSSLYDKKNFVSWREIEILNNSNGRPFVKLLNENEKINSIDLSMSHCKEYATANVVVMYNE